MKDLKELRAQIDDLDNQILDLFEKRMDIASDVAEYKISTGKKVYDKKREDEKLLSLSSRASDDFSKQSIYELYSQIMSISRKRQFQIIAHSGKKLDTGFLAYDDFDFSDAVVCYQGVEGAYSQQAMYAFFDKSFKSAFHVDKWKNAMDAISSGEADYAVLPIENSSAGSIAENFDLLSEYNVSIIGEQILKVDHALLGVRGAKISDIKHVYSHPQAIMQCDEYIRTKHMDWDANALHNTAVAAMKVRDDGDISKAAIGSKLNAEIYGLDILEEQIQDNKNNETRFIIVSSEKKFKRDANKISVCLEISNDTGSLYKTLSHFIFNNININRIESRPIKDVNWQYRFFIDIDGNLLDESVNNALVGLNEECAVLRILGNY